MYTLPVALLPMPVPAFAFSRALISTAGSMTASPTCSWLPATAMSLTWRRQAWRHQPFHHPHRHRPLATLQPLADSHRCAKVQGGLRLAAISDVSNGSWKVAVLLLCLLAVATCLLAIGLAAAHPTLTQACALIPACPHLHHSCTVDRSWSSFAAVASQWLCTMVWLIWCTHCSSLHVRCLTIGTSSSLWRCPGSQVGLGRYIIAGATAKVYIHAPLLFRPLLWHLF